MSISRCFHPQVVRNRYTGELVTVSCGECDACRNSRSFRWVTRLDIESSCHKYVVFATLTYDDQHVPQIMKYYRENKDNKDNNVTEFIHPDGRVVSPSHIKANFSKRDERFLESSQFLNVLSKRDFQLFIKRLRYYFQECDQGALLRYFIGAEYGPETLRPHGHMLLFFDSRRCADQIQELLSKSWSYGAVYDPHFVSGSAASYCASYINSVGLLPKIYLHKSIRPFSMFSKCPAIGSLFKNDSEFREAFNRGDSSFTWYNSSTNKFEDVPFWRSLVSRLYPRCQYFDSLTHDERVTLYRLIQEFPTSLSCREVAKRLFCEYIDNGRDTFLSCYFSNLLYGSSAVRGKCYEFVGVPGYSDDSLPFPFPDTFKQVLVPRDYISVFLPSACSKLFYLKWPNPLVSFVSAVRRVQYQSQIFGISIEEYVSKIELWLRKVEVQRYSDYVSFQDDYFKQHPVWHYVYFDYSFYERVTSVSYDSLRDSERSFLLYLFDGVVPLCKKSCKDGFGDDIEYYVLDVPSYDSMSFYLGFKVSESSKAAALVKQKHNNDYVMQRKSKFKNIVEYYSLN